MNFIESDQQDKTRVPQQQRGVQTKQKIVEAAIKLFSEKGYHQTNSKEIAREAGVATGSFYSYFKDKREVFKEALYVYNAQFNSILHQSANRILTDRLKKWDVIRNIINMYLEAHRIHEGFHNELVAMSLSDPEIQQIVNGLLAESYRITAEFFSQWKDELRVQDTEAAAAVVNMAVHQVIDAIFYKRAPFQKERLIEELVEMVGVYLFGCERPERKPGGELR